MRENEESSSREISSDLNQLLHDIYLAKKPGHHSGRMRGNCPLPSVIGAMTTNSLEIWSRKSLQKAGKI
jgi:hypothetical protein